MLHKLKPENNSSMERRGKHGFPRHSEELIASGKGINGKVCQPGGSNHTRAYGHEPISITTAKIGLSGLREAEDGVLWLRKGGGSGRNCGRR